LSSYICDNILYPDSSLVGVSLNTSNQDRQEKSIRMTPACTVLVY